MRGLKEEDTELMGLKEEDTELKGLKEEATELKGLKEEDLELSWAEGGRLGVEGAEGGRTCSPRFCHKSLRGECPQTCSPVSVTRAYMVNVHKHVHPFLSQGLTW